MNVIHRDTMDIESKIAFYQQRHGLTIAQIGELREFAGTEIVHTGDRARKLDSLLKMAELIRLSRLFHANNLEFIPIKGPLLSWRLHRDFTIRYSNDLDILVKQADLEKGIEVLKNDGYRFDGSAPTSQEFPGTKNKTKLVLELKYHKVFMHPERKIQLEIHWNLTGYPIIAKQKLDQLIEQNSVPFTFQTEQFTVFNKELDFVYLMIHGALHHWYRLKWLHDIYAYSKDAELDWKKIKGISNQFSAGHLVYQALRLADIYWPLPDRLKPLIVNKNKKNHSLLLTYPIKTISAQHFHPEIVHWHIHDIYELARYTLSLFPKAILTNRFLKGMLFNEGDLKVLNLPDRFAFMYVFLRPVLLIYRKCCRDRKTGNNSR